MELENKDFEERVFDELMKMKEKRIVNNPVVYQNIQLVY